MTHTDTIAQDRRKQESTPQNKPTSSFESNSLIDIFSTANHSDDFVQTRHSYIASRLWVMCLFFGISVPLFSLFDFALFNEQLATDLLVSRIVLSALLLSLAWVVKNHPRIENIRFGLFLSFLFPSLFSAYCIHLFSTHSSGEVPIIFSSMPYLIVAMLGLFPLTILGSAVLLSGIFLAFCASLLLYPEINTLTIINKIWLFTLFSGISLWLQSGQLSMLMKLYRECTIDPLTKLFNRRVLIRRAEYVRKKQQPFCVLMLDLDRFKRINDTYGHNAGDSVLVATANVMKKELRRSDVMARFGGEEFIAVLPCTLKSDAVDVANRIKLSIQNHPIKINDDESISVTCSIGVAQSRPKEDISALLNRADDLLYQAKSSGRNTVIAEETSLKKAS